MAENKIKVLVIDDNEALLVSLAASLETEGFEVDTAPDGKTGQEKINSTAPDIVFLDVILPDFNGFDICRDVKKNDRTSRIPIIMVTGDRTVDIDKGFAVGADDCIIKPLDVANLKQRIMKLVKKKDKMLIVEDDRQVSDVLTGIVTRHGCEVKVLKDGTALIDQAKEYCPDIVLLDITLAIPPDGIELCRQLKSDPATKDIPVLMLTGNECTKSIDQCFKYGAADYIFKPFNVPDLLGKIKKYLAGPQKEAK